MNRIVRTLGALAIVTCAAFAQTRVEAAPGQVILVSGEVLVGDLVAVKNGEYVMIRLATGEVRAIAWIEIGSVTNAPPGTPVPANPEVPPQPPPNGGYTAPPSNGGYTQPPPNNGYAAPPPPTYADTTGSASESSEPRDTGLYLGARVGYVTPGGSIGKADDGTTLDTKNYATSGFALEGDLGFHFTPGWAFYGFFEHDFLGKGDPSTVGDGADPANSNLAGAGFNLNTNPRGPIGFYLDLATGYRWLNLSAGSGGITATQQLKGWEVLRLGLGMSIKAGRTIRLDLHWLVSAGTFTTYSTGGACESSAGGCLSGDVPSGNQATHTFNGFFASIVFL